MAAVAGALALNVASADAQWLNHLTPGIPRTADGKADLNAPAPMTADGRPDLAGVWASECPFTSECWQQSLFFDLAGPLKANEAVMTPWAAAIAARRESRDHVDDPLGYCIPPGVPRILFSRPFRILSTPGITAFLHETDISPIFREVFTDGRGFPDTIESPAWLGYAVGRWDGNSFVVESRGFRDGGWLDTRKGRPHSDALHVTERYTRTDFGHMDLTITIDDRKAFRQPWTVASRLTLLPDTELLEGACENHGRTMEHRRVAPAPPEPPSPND